MGPERNSMLRPANEAIAPDASPAADQGAQFSRQIALFSADFCASTIPGGSPNAWVRGPKTLWGHSESPVAVSNLPPQTRVYFSVLGNPLSIVLSVSSVSGILFAGSTIAPV